MKDFLFVYRADAPNAQPSPEEMQASMNQWMNWLGNIGAQNKLVDRGNRLQPVGKVLRGTLVTDGPYTEIKESIGGYSIVKADSIDEAIELAKDCPIFQVGGSVEVRAIA